MIRLIIVIFSCLFVINISHICDFAFPLNDEDSILNWDKLKHILYLSAIGLSWLMFIFKPNDRYEKYVKLCSYVLVFGIIIPIIIDKRNSYETQKWYDFVLIFVAVYFGSKDIFPKTHKWYRVCQTKK